MRLQNIGVGINTPRQTKGGCKDGNKELSVDNADGNKDGINTPRQKSRL